MANCMRNYLSIDGSIESRKALIEMLKIKDRNIKDMDCLFDFSNVIPMPEDLYRVDHADADFKLVSSTGTRYVALEGVLRKEMDKFNVVVCGQDEIISLVTHNLIEKGMKFPSELTRATLVSGEDLQDIPEYHFSSLDTFIAKEFNKRKYGACDWYEWANENWGVKWSVPNDCSIAEDFSSIQFSTAWSPCLPVIKKLAECLPDLKFKYKFIDADDYLYGECGTAYYNDGKLSSIVYFQQDSTGRNETALHLLGVDIVEERLMERGVVSESAVKKKLSYGLER